MTALGSALGRAAGWIAAPGFALVSFARQARTFHPRGPTFHASVTRHPDAARDLVALSDRLSGHALVRFSGALWKRAETRIDVLGVAIRLREREDASPRPTERDQDLLFATIRRPWTMFLAPLTTNVRDYLANDYFAVSPFDAGLERPIYLRIHPEHTAAASTESRSERLVREVARDEVRLDLEVAEAPFGPWRPLLVVSLERLADVDGEALRFRPFRAGRGVRPRGFVHALRRGVYTLSQRARPDHATPSNA